MASSGTPRIEDELVALLPRLRRFAAALTGSLTDGDDLVQAACERALSRRGLWQPGTRLDNWVFSIAQNLWIDQVRKARARGPHVELEPGLPASGADPSRHAEARLTLDRVRRAVAELPPQQRLVLALVLVEGLSYRDAAARLEVPVGTVMSRLSRARARLADLAGLDRPAPGPRPAEPEPTKGERWTKTTTR